MGRTDSRVTLLKKVQRVYTAAIREAHKTTSQLLATRDLPEKCLRGCSSDGEAHRWMMELGRFMRKMNPKPEKTTTL